MRDYLENVGDGPRATLVTMAEADALLGFAPGVLRDKRARYATFPAPAVKGRPMLFDLAQLEAWLDRQRAAEVARQAARGAVADERMHALGFESREHATRETAHLTLAQAAERLGVNETRISKWRQRWGVVSERDRSGDARGPGAGRCQLGEPTALAIQAQLRERGFPDRAAAVEATAHMTARAAAKLLGVSDTTLMKWRRKYGD